MAVSISVAQARRFLIRRQNFVVNGSPYAGYEGVAQALQHLEAVQIDPLRPFERNQHQVLYNRVRSYRPEWLDRLLYQDRNAFEYYCNALCVLPMEDYPYFRCAMQQQRQQLTERLDDNMHQVMRQIVQHIHAYGEAAPSAFNSGQKISGWWDNEPRTKIEKLAIDYLHLTGELMISQRGENQRSRSYDLPQRLVESNIFAQEVESTEWERRALYKFLRAYGLSRLTIQRFGWYNAPKVEKKRLLLELMECGEVVQVAVEGVKTPYYCLAADLPDLTRTEPLPTTEAAVILAPLDNLLWDRDRLEDFWGFHYRWEVYVPAAKRQYGYYVVPILHGEWLVGRIEMRAERDQEVLRVDNLWFESQDHQASLPFVRQAVAQEAEYLGLSRIAGI